MNILGISGGLMRGNQDAAAALLVDGKLVFAQEEERFSRDKHAIGVLPERAVAAALSHSGLNIRDIDYLAFHTEFTGIKENIQRYFNHSFGYCPPLRFVNHHLAHAASTFYASGYEESMILTTDLSGDGISTSLCYGKGTEIQVIQRFFKPQSLGIFYSIVTQILGFRRDSDEYKVMGMAGYGRPTEDLSWLLKVEDGNYVLNEDYIIKVNKGSPNPSKQEPLYSDAFVERVGFARHKGEPFTDAHFNFAASAQHTLNKTAESLVRWLHKQTGSRNLCIAGGVGLNCVMNQELLAMEEVDRIFVQPASSDAGTSLGAAYTVAVAEGEKLAPFPGAHLGNQFDEGQMRAEIENLGVPYREVSNPAEVAAKSIAAGKIIGWFQGQHEFGPRALGARSILADPRRAEMKDLINVRVKFREEFRPFAPSVLEEDANKYFAINGHSLPYMAVTCNVRAEKKDDIPSVVHVDGTARIQTVSQSQCPLYYDLISSFASESGVPVVLNTSYNVKGQPIVNTPTDAVGTLYGSGMDMAIIGPYVVEKNSR